MLQFRKKLIGDRAFYKMVLVVALPMILQNGISNFVNLLDNIMVGQLGTEQMSGVSIVNQLMMVYNISLFGAVSGASIFSAQFYGQGNIEGVRYTFRFKLIFCTLIALGFMLVFGLAKYPLIFAYLNDENIGNLFLTQQSAMTYLFVMMFGMLPSCFTQIYASTLRETGKTILPMVAGVIAVATNLLFNYILIFGHFGVPALGVAGAAIATVISRLVELAIVVSWTHVHSKKNAFIVGAYQSLHIPMNLVKQIFWKGLPLLGNEFLWSGGQAMLVQCYSMRGLNAVAAFNIATTVTGLFNVVFISLGSAISIIVGQLLGAGKLEEAVEADRKMIFFAVMSCFVIGAILFIVAPLFPEIYNTSEEVRRIATGVIRISALLMPLYSFYNAAYFTLRSGGKTVVTFLFDSCYCWVVSIPIAFVLSRFTSFAPVMLFLLCQLAEVLKAVVGAVLLKKRIWVQNIVETMQS